MSNNVVKILNLPTIGKRSYVHSTTFLKTIIQYSIGVDKISIKFKNLSTTPTYQLLISEQEQEHKADAEGRIVFENGMLQYFYFIPLPIDKKFCQGESLLDLPIQNIDDFIDFIVSDSKNKCEGLYDEKEFMLYMAKIDLENLSKLKFPLDINYSMKHTDSRFVVTYYYQHSKIANLLGLLKNAK